MIHEAISGAIASFSLPSKGGYIDFNAQIQPEHVKLAQQSTAVSRIVIGEFFASVGMLDPVRFLYKVCLNLLALLHKSCDISHCWQLFSYTYTWGEKQSHCKISN